MTNQNINDLIESSIITIMLNFIMMNIFTETVHMLAMVLGAVLSAAAVFFTNRFLRKRFPDFEKIEQDELESGQQD
jgi:multisubunit Na+/H+ antiporter MnhE subunit